MLQRLHEKVQGWMAWAVVGLVASTFILFGVSYYANSRLNSNVKATVNGEDVSRSDFDAVYRRIKQRASQVNATSEPLLKAQALEQIVLDRVMLEASKKNQFYISPKQVESNILDNADFKEEGQFSSHRFQQLLSNNMFTQSDYLAVMERGMINNQLRFSFMGTSFALNNELERYIQFSNQKRNFKYFEINPSKLVVSHKPTLKLLEKYYKDNADLYKTSEQVSLEYVLLSMKEELKKIKISDKEAELYYKENQSNYMTPAKYQLERIFLRGTLTDPTTASPELQKKLDAVNLALKTMSFDNVSKQYSEDLLANKSVKPWLTLGMLDKQSARAVLDLKLNQVSEPVFTPKGVEYIKLVNKQDAKLTPFSMVKNSIVKTLSMDKAQQSFQGKAEQLADLSYQSPDNLQSVADPLGLPVLTSELAMKEKGYKTPLNHDNVIAAAFSPEVLNERNNSQPIQINDDALVVIRIKQHEKSTLKPFKDVKPDIEAHYLYTEQLKSLQSLVNQLVSVPETEVDKLLSDNQLTWILVNNSMRAAPANNVDPLINEFAFSFKLSKNKNIHYQQLSTGKWIVVQLTNVVDGKLSDITLEQKALIANQLASNYGINMYELYVQSLKKNAKVDLLS